MTIHSETNEITRSGQFWALAHFSKLSVVAPNASTHKAMRREFITSWLRTPTGDAWSFWGIRRILVPSALQLGEATTEIHWGKIPWRPSPGVELEVKEKKNRDLGKDRTEAFPRLSVSATLLSLYSRGSPQ